MTTMVLERQVNVDEAIAEGRSVAKSLIDGANLLNKLMDDWEISAKHPEDDSDEHN